MLLNLRAALVDVLAYNPMNEPQVAVYVVARAKTELEGFFKDIDFMETFEEKEKQLKDIQKQQADLDGEEDQ